MSMFASQGTPEAGPTERLTILAAGLKVTGDLETDGVIKIEGTVEGTVRAQGQVLVARGGVVHGDIHTRGAVIGGRVLGSLVADERVEVQAGALIEGDLSTPRLIVQEGGDVNGRVMMGPSPAAARKGAPAGEKKEPVMAVVGA